MVLDCGVCCLTRIDAREERSFSFISRGTFFTLLFIPALTALLFSDLEYLSMYFPDYFVSLCVSIVVLFGLLFVSIQHRNFP